MSTPINQLNPQMQNNQTEENPSNTSTDNSHGGEQPGNENNNGTLSPNGSSTGRGHNGNEGGRGGGARGGGFGRRGRFGGRCYNCGRTGHMSKYCKAEMQKKRGDRGGGRKRLERQGNGSSRGSGNSETSRREERDVEPREKGKKYQINIYNY